MLLAPGISEATCTGSASADVPNSRDGCWAQATWPHSLLFLADLEPGVAEQLVAACVLHPRAFDAQPISGIASDALRHPSSQAAARPAAPEGLYKWRRLYASGSGTQPPSRRRLVARSSRSSLVCPLSISCLPSLHLLHICGRADLAKSLSS